MRLTHQLLPAVVLVRTSFTSKIRLVQTCRIGAVRHFWRLARRPQVESGRSKEMSYTPPLSLAW